jgi:hypothetical protein
MPFEEMEQEARKRLTEGANATLSTPIESLTLVKRTVIWVGLRNTRQRSRGRCPCCAEFRRPI